MKSSKSFALALLGAVAMLSSAAVSTLAHADGAPIYGGSYRLNGPEATGLQLNAPIGDGNYGGSLRLNGPQSTNLNLMGPEGAGTYGGSLRLNGSTLNGIDAGVLGDNGSSSGGSKRTNLPLRHPSVQPVRVALPSGEVVEVR